MATPENTPSVDRLLRLLFQQDREHAVMLLDTTGTILAWLPGAEKVFGYSAEEVIGQNFRILFTPEDLEKGMAQYELDVARTAVPAEDDRWMRRKDGLRFWATGICVPLREGERIVGFGKVLRNRTDLNGRIESLESQLGQLQLANDRKNVFIGTLAHELRNPLASLSNAAELLRVSLPRTEETAFALSTIERQIGYMSRMVEDLLDVTRVSAGKVQLKKERVALNDIVRAAVETCRPSIDERTHDLRIIMSSVPILIDADPQRMQQVFVNLVQNAAKYTAYGGNIWVKASVEGNDAVVKVEDSGVGISPEMLPRIFDLFTQSEFAGDAAKEGLGIGLSVVKELTALHGGTVQVRSDGIGKGSEFTVRLPLAGPDQNRPNRPSIA